MTVPLLIGGATTSRQHTAVKIAPNYSRATVHVPDASRVTDVVSSLLSAGQHQGFTDANRADQAKLREQYATRSERPTVSYEKARANRLQLDFSAAPTPAFTGARQVDVDLSELVPYIDWTFFFAAWELKGRFPAILDDPDPRRRRARGVRARAAAAEAHRRRQADSRARRLRVLARVRRRRRHRAVRAGRESGVGSPESGVGRPRPARAVPIPHAAAAGGHRRQQAEPLARRLRRAVRRGRRAGLCRRVCGDRRARRRCPREEVRGRARRLLGDYREGPGGSAGRGLRRVPARARPRRLGPARGAESRRPDRRALPGHPAGVRLSGLPRPQPEGPAVRSAAARAPSAWISPSRAR